MYSIKVQVRANVNNLYINDDIVTSNINIKDQQAVYGTIHRALCLFLSADTIEKVTKHTIVQCVKKSLKASIYQQIIEESINGCYFKISVRNEESYNNSRKGMDSVFAER